MPLRQGQARPLGVQAMPMRQGQAMPLRQGQAMPLRQGQGQTMPLRQGQSTADTPNQEVVQDHDGLMA